VIADEHRSRVYLIAGRMLGTLLLDGFAAATWRVTDGELQIEPFGKITKAQWKAIEPEADALMAFLRP
jgi:hypothetical protein